MGSVLVAVRAGLIAALAELDEFEGWECSYIPKKGSKARNRCFTDRAEFSHDPASLRAAKTFRKEEGSFDLVLYAENVGANADPVAMSEALQAVGEAAENWVAIHANWSNNALCEGLNWLVVGGEGGGRGRLSEQWADNGLSIALIYPINYRARLT